MQQSSLIEETRDIYTPGRLNNAVKTQLETSFRSIWIEGEISNLSRPASGHVYFSLKDSGAQVRCAWFKQQQRRSPIRPESGMQVLIRARVTLYPARGDFQLLVERMEPAGHGQLQLEFEALKARLDKEGLFDPQRKRELPRFPKRIAIITSPTGAAIRDVLSVLERRWPSVEVSIISSSVQGDRAPAELLRAIGSRASREADVILLTRGGGSLEDLWAFNDEQLARAVFESPVPVVSAVGHEIDFTIADFVADLRAPTPSAAAEILVPQQEEVAQRIDQLQLQIQRLMQSSLLRKSATVEHLHKRLNSGRPEQQLAAASARARDLSLRLANRMNALLQLSRKDADNLEDRLQQCNPERRLQALEERIQASQQRLHGQMKQRLNLSGTRLAGVSRSLDAISPLAVLHRGYSMTRSRDGVILRSADTVKPGDEIETRLETGVLESKVTGVSQS